MSWHKDNLTNYILFLYSDKDKILICYDIRTNNKSQNNSLIAIGSTRVLPEIFLKFRLLKYRRSAKYI
jgi:hypothetical protein